MFGFLRRNKTEQELISKGYNEALEDVSNIVKDRQKQISRAYAKGYRAGLKRGLKYK